MESIKEWASYNKDPGYGDGGGNRNSSGHCYNDGSSYGCGDGSGSGVVFGFGCGDGSGYNTLSGNTGSGYGNSNCSGYGVGESPGAGYGYAAGSCCATNLGIVRYNHATGSRCATNLGIIHINGQEVYDIDGMPMVFSKVRGNVAHGSIVRDDLSLVPCCVVRSEGYYAHGETLADAKEALTRKIFQRKTETERITEFVQRFPKGKAQKGTEYYEWHHILTGSCRMGRDEFVKSRGLDLSKEYTPAEFIQLTKESYGGNIIKKLEKAYAQQERS